MRRIVRVTLALDLGRSEFAGGNTNATVETHRKRATGLANHLELMQKYEMVKKLDSAAPPLRIVLLGSLVQQNT